MAKTEGYDVVEALRAKSEELDADEYLQSSFGGYTKQSVKDYLSMMRKQQQATAETFYNNLQTVFNEKEALKKANELLQNRLTKLETEYKSLGDALELQKLEGTDYTAQDIFHLKNAHAALEESFKKQGIEKAALENKIEHLLTTVDDLNNKMDLQRQETLAARETLVVEKQASQKLREQVSELTMVIEGKQDEIKYLKALQTEGQTVRLNGKINELTQELTTQSETMARLAKEMEEKEQALAVVQQDNSYLQSQIDNLRSLVNSGEELSQKLREANRTLHDRLREENEKALEAIHEKAELTVGNIKLQRMLEEAKAKLSLNSLTEQQIKKMEALKEYLVHSDED